MCRIKFQGESLETFFIYEVVQYPENDDLGFVDPPGRARGVTVNCNLKKVHNLNEFPESALIILAD